MKRSVPLRPTAFHRKEPSCSRSEHPRAKDKECAHCHKPFTPFQSTQRVCNKLRCAMGFATAERKAKDKAERAKTKARKEAIKTIPQLLKEAQGAFNSYTRERDRLAGHRCISSGRPLDWSGNGVDAGHYRSVGSAPHLRFDERNCHAQSKHDNQWKSGNAVDYRLGLIERIGLASVEALEADNRIHKWRREELIELKATYRAKRRALNQLNATP